MSLKPINLSFSTHQVPHVILVNNTGTTLIRIDQGEDNPYRDLRGGESRELRSGAAVSIALPRQPLSPSASPPVDDLALPTEFMEVNARWDAENLADATGLGFWFVHCVRGT
ncbi:hypothetical protein IMZ48_20145 [Candidatus Bathyarchaeota archaeon]|nr:hypothetical protein [Candidatus Bathyarchaeota archaeon]